MKGHKNHRKKIGIILLLISVGIGIAGCERKTVFKGKYQAEMESFGNQKKPSFTRDMVAYGIYPIEREQKREVICDTYTVKSKGEMKEELRISFPVIELKNQDQEMQQRLNDYFYREMKAMRNTFKESIGYTIVYADERYLSILYHSSNHIRPVTISLETGCYVGIRELWIGETRLLNHFLEAEFWYCEPDQLQRIVKELKNNTKEEVLNEQVTSLFADWYLTKEGIGVVLQEELCAEIIYNWGDHVRNKETLVDYEVEEIRQIKRDSYEITEEVENIAAKDEHYNESSQMHYPKIEMEDKEKAEQINQIFYKMAFHEMADNEQGFMNQKYAGSYNITYANERYISILYQIDSVTCCYVGVTVDLETGKQVSIEELGITEEEVERTFLETDVFYSFGGIDVQLIFQERTRQEVKENWDRKKHMYDYFFREGKIGLIVYSIWDRNTWIEYPYDWERSGLIEDVPVMW